MKFMRILRMWFKHATAVVCKRWILRSALWILWLDTPPERKYPSLVTERLYRVSIRYLCPTSQLLHISWLVPSGNLLHSYWKWPLYSWFTHRTWAIFHSYVSLPKGKPPFSYGFSMVYRRVRPEGHHNQQNPRSPAMILEALPTQVPTTSVELGMDGSSRRCSLW